MNKRLIPVFFLVLITLCSLVLTNCGWIPVEEPLPEYVMEIEKATIIHEFGGYTGIEIVYKDYYGLDTWGGVFKDSSARKPLTGDEFLKCNGVVFLGGTATYKLADRFYQKSGELTPGMTATIYSDWAYIKDTSSGDSVFDRPSKIIAKIRFTPSTVVISEEE